MEHRVQVGVECPQCHWKQFIEVGTEEALLKFPLYRDIQDQLEAWIRARCPDHIGAIANLSKN